MQIEPINGRILVRPLAAPDRTAGGIHLPDSAKENSQEGEVVAVAEDATEEVAVGDRVVYRQFSGNEVKIEGEDHVLLAFDDLLVKYVAADEIPE